jgi:hypothetical protein
MAYKAIVGLDPDSLGNSLSEVMLAPDITPGDDVSYNTCKTLFLYHPLGWKMVAAPLQLALSEPRTITVPDSPGERAVEAYFEQWKIINADAYIFQTMAMSRVYGIATCAMLAAGKEPNVNIDPFEIPDLSISFNVYDPLNTSGSIVLNQDPTALDFMHTKNVAIQQNQFHRSRSITVMNEFPVYLAWNPAAFGFVGRSVYQRAFYPMKSYLKSMITDDMIETKVGVLVAKIKQAGSIANQVMKVAAAFKRQVVKEAETTNVINITPDEAVESLNLQNMDAPHSLARRNILENIATAADMPIKLLAQEAFVEGFGEGTEDAKAIARFIERERQKMQPLVDYFDRIAQLRAWTPSFYSSIQKDFPETYGGVPYKEAFYKWVNSFTAVWPSLLKEPDSEQVKLDDVKLKAVIALIQVFEPILDSINKLALYQWAQDNINSNKIMFTAPLEFDYEALSEHLDEMEEQQADMQQSQMEAMAEGGGEGGGGGSTEVPVKMGRADRADLMKRFDKAAALLDNQFPEVRDVIPIAKLKERLTRGAARR